MAGSAAVMGDVFHPIESLASTDRMGSSIYSLRPCRYELRNLMQNATRNGGMALGNPVFAPQGQQYCVKMCWQPMVIHAASTASIGGMTFRAAEDQNYYYLVFFPHGVGFSRIRNNVGQLTKRVRRPINVRHPAMFELEMDGATFRVKDTARRGSPTILTWTDRTNTSPRGNHLDHWTKGGVSACWEFVTGRPM